MGGGKNIGDTATSAEAQKMGILIQQSGITFQNAADQFKVSVDEFARNVGDNRKEIDAQTAQRVQRENAPTIEEMKQAQRSFHGQPHTREQFNERLKKVHGSKEAIRKRSGNPTFRAGE